MTRRYTAAEEAIGLLRGYVRSDPRTRHLSHRQDDLVAALDALDATVERIRTLHYALSEARPYVYNVTCLKAEPWRAETAQDILTRVDFALEAHVEA